MPVVSNWRSVAALVRTVRLRLCSGINRCTRSHNCASARVCGERFCSRMLRLHLTDGSTNGFEQCSAGIIEYSALQERANDAGGETDWDNWLLRTSKGIRHRDLYV
uniref:Uncharacterized protein n=1 Tax=Ralstonia solanacearum TaxID=305 RepID=A0A0S4UY34_RALSL|nr:protein of unknown function [Ralstonia solanacearum]